MAAAAAAAASMSFATLNLSVIHSDVKLEYDAELFGVLCFGSCEMMNSTFAATCLRQSNKAYNQNFDVVGRH